MSILKAFGLLRIDDEFVELIRARVQTRCAKVPTKVYKRRDAQKALVLAACEAIVECFCERSGDGQRYTLTASWPQASAIIKDDEALVEIWVGDDFSDSEIQPVRVILDRGGRRDMSERIGAAIQKPFKAKHPGPVTVAKPAAKPASARPIQAKPPTGQVKQTVAASTKQVETNKGGTIPLTHVSTTARRVRTGRQSFRTRNKS